MSDRTDALVERLVSDLQPVVPLQKRRGMAVATLQLALGSLLLVTLLGLRRDFSGGQPNPTVLLVAGIFLVLALSSAWEAIDMAQPSVGTRREGWNWTAMMAGVVPGSALVLILADTLGGRSIDFDRGGILCLALGTAVGFLTGGTLVHWLRRGAATLPSRAGLIVGVASGAAGTFAVSLWCPHDSMLHIGIWHGATVIISGLLGRIILPPLLRW